MSYEFLMWKNNEWRLLSRGGSSGGGDPENPPPPPPPPDPEVPPTFLWTPKHVLGIQTNASNGPGSYTVAQENFIGRQMSYITVNAGQGSAGSGTQTQQRSNRLAGRLSSVEGLMSIHTAHLRSDGKPRTLIINQLITVGASGTANHTDPSFINLLEIANGNTQILDYYRALIDLYIEYYVDNGWGQYCVFRPAHEACYEWYPWSGNPVSGHAEANPTNYRAAWRRMVDTCRDYLTSLSHDPDQLKWDWNNCINAYSNIMAQQWPGDDYVDFITNNVYDSVRTGFGPSGGHNPGSAGYQLLSTADAMSDLQNFLRPFADVDGGNTNVATAHSVSSSYGGRQTAKPFGIDEWGVLYENRTSGGVLYQRGGWDNPHFIQSMHGWIQTELNKTPTGDQAAFGRRICWTLQFDEEASVTSHRMGPGTKAFDFANARAKYLELFGGPISQTPPPPLPTAHTPIPRLTPDFEIQTNTQYTLASSSSECPQGGIITEWDFSLTSKPASSTTTLSWTPTTSSATFTPTHVGNYVVTVRVKCSHNYWSDWHSGRTYNAVSGTPTVVDIKGEGSTIESGLASDPNVLWAMNFENSDWPSRVGVTVSGFTANEARANYGVGGLGSQLRGATPANQAYGIHRIINFQSVGVPELEEAYLRYEVWFPAGYSWNNGIQDVHGKLPGLAGKSNSPDWAVPGGGVRYNGSTQILTTSQLQEADCFSARLMFHVQKRIKDYLYVPSPVGTITTNRVYGAHTFGMNGGSFVTFNDNDVLNTVEQRVVMNTPGVTNGIHQVWLNGVLCINRTNVMWRGANRANVKINKLWLTWFFGGPVQDYPNVLSYARFDNFVLSTAPIGERS